MWHLRDWHANLFRRPTSAAVPFKAASLDKRAYKRNKKNKRTAGSLRLPHEAEGKKNCLYEKRGHIYNNNKHLKGSSFFFTFILLFFLKFSFHLPCVCVCVFVVVGPVYCLCRKHLPQTTAATTATKGQARNPLFLSFPANIMSP